MNYATLILYCGNQSTTILSQTLFYTPRPNIFYVREKFLDRSLNITHIPTSDQVTDIFTKPFSQIWLCHLCYKLNVLDYFHEP